MSQTSQAIEKADTSPRALVATYSDSFTAVLPSHIAKPETWIRLAQGALKKGRRVADGRTELEVAATNNPPVFLAALLDCARLGLEPGTDEYYLTPRKVKGKLEVLGIIGYQGIIELIYRAGAVSSVVVEVVYQNDEFVYRPGRDEIPQHEVDWDADDRGPLRLAYGFCRMKDGAYSKVVVLNRADIARIKAKSQGADGQYSPWKTNEPSMWMKSVARQLRKWVPTSAEYRREMERSQAAALEQSEARDLPVAPPDEDDMPAPSMDSDVIDAEIVDEPEYAPDDPERPM